MRRYIDLIHDTAETSHEHQHCFSTPKQYGISAETAKKGLAILTRAVAAAENETIRTRLEKATIAPYAVLVEPATRLAQQKAHAQLRGHDDGSPFTPDPQLQQATRPYLKTFFDLCSKHGVTRFAEHETVEDVKKMLRNGFNLGENEEF